MLQTLLDGCKPPIVEPDNESGQRLHNRARPPDPHSVAEADDENHVSRGRLDLLNRLSDPVLIPGQVKNKTPQRVTGDSAGSLRASIHYEPIWTDVHLAIVTLGKASRPWALMRLVEGTALESSLSSTS